jgi:hypothetical protein
MVAATEQNFSVEGEACSTDIKDRIEAGLLGELTE